MRHLVVRIWLLLIVRVPAHLFEVLVHARIVCMIVVCVDVFEDELGVVPILHDAMVDTLSNRLCQVLLFLVAILHPPDVFLQVGLWLILGNRLKLQVLNVYYVVIVINAFGFSVAVTHDTRTAV